MPKIIIAVVSLMKSGKSTLLNALMNEEFLPSATQPATASITYIKHMPELSSGRLTVTSQEGDDDEVYEGRVKIHEKIKVVNEQRRCRSGTAPIEMTLETPIPSFQAVDESGEVLLVDTPGPNEHGAGLESEVQTILQKSDVLFYILDYTKLGSDDEAAMFKTLIDAVLPLLKSTSCNVRRMYYILNKFDTHSKRNDPCMEDIKANVAKKIESLLPVGARVSPSDIVPISAANALLSRQVIKRRTDKDFLHDFLKKAMGESFEDDISEDEWEAKALEKAPGLEKRSRMESIEKEIVAKVVAQKRIINVLSILDLLKIQLEKKFNDKLLELGCMDTSIEELEAAVTAMEQTRTAIQRDLGTLKTVCERMKVRTLQKAGSFFDLLRKDISDTIDVCFSPNEQALQQSYIARS
jgi:GTPase SAR1 family protein